MLSNSYINKSTGWGHEYFERLYEDTFINEIAKDLKLPKNKEPELKENLVAAAVYFEIAKKAHFKYLAPSKEAGALEDLKKAADEFIKQYEKMSNTFTAPMRLLIAIKESHQNTSTSEATTIMLSQFIEGGKFKINVLPDFISFLSKALKIAATKTCGKIDGRKLLPIEVWLHNVDHFWINNVPIAFSLGKYVSTGREGFYKGKALPIIHKILSKLDAKITLEEISSAFKKYQLDKKKQIFVSSSNQKSKAIRQKRKVSISLGSKK